jgi:hypothetical protein
MNAGNILASCSPARESLKNAAARGAVCLHTTFFASRLDAGTAEGWGQC